MYLVLTALLALNVSAEILNAFKTVNNSLTNSNAVLQNSTANVFKAFADYKNDPKNAENARIWEPKAQAVQQLSTTLYNHIEGLKNKLMDGSGRNLKEGDTTFKEDNLDAPTRIMDQEGEGEKLRKMLEDYKNNVLAVDPKIKAEFSSKIPINTAIPKSQTGSTSNSWTTAYFHMTPTIAALTMLSKFQNDVKNAENQVTNFCLQQVGGVVFKLDKFEPLVGTNATYFMPGDEMQIDAGLGAFNADARPDVVVNGTRVPVNEKGIATHKFKVNGSGNVNVVLNYTDPNTGEKKSINKTIPYTVGMPSGASVFLEKMNVMYVGVENPITISGGSVGREKVRVSFPGGTIVSQNGDRYVMKPTNTGMSEVIVNADGKIFKFPMRLKSLPRPSGFVGASRGGRISAAAFKAQGGLIARLEDSEFEAPFRVVGYTLGASGGAFPTYQQATNEGNRWAGNAKSIIDRATPGTTIFFDEIRVIGPDGKVVSIQPMVFQLQ